LQTLPANLKLKLAFAAFTNSFEVEAILTLRTIDFHEIIVLFGELRKIQTEFLQHIFLFLRDFDFTQIRQQPLNKKFP
jgi:hypothetical protein